MSAVPAWRLTLAIGLALPTCLAAAAEAPRLNFILVLTDDQGYGDLGCYGAGDLHTPHLDALAAAGVRMSNFYSCSPVCSPARAGLLTARYPDRSGILGVLRKHHERVGLDVHETTLADALAQHGYATGLCGKWHLGELPQYRPRARGFQESYGALCGMLDYYTHVGSSGPAGQASLFRNDKPIEEQGYFTELVTREALAFLDRNRQRPFFLYLPYTAPHLPQQAPPAGLGRFAELSQRNPQRALYAAMLQCVDDGVGQIREKLKRLAIADRTVIVFLSDQGWSQQPKHRAASDNGGLSSRGLGRGKYYLTEGGLRVPCIISIPGRAPGVSRLLAINLDLMPTILALAGCPAPTARPLDGVNLCPLLDDPARAPQRTLFWRFRDDLIGTGDQWAARRGPWKAIHIDGRTQLYNIDDDEAETQDRAAQHPELLAELQAEHQRWLSTLPNTPWISARTP